MTSSKLLEIEDGLSTLWRSYDSLQHMCSEAGGEMAQVGDLLWHLNAEFRRQVDIMEQYRRPEGLKVAE
jgi:hypothetical protein